MGGAVVPQWWVSGCSDGRQTRHDDDSSMSHTLITSSLSAALLPVSAVTAICV